MIEPNDLLLGGVLPAVVSAVVLATVWKLSHHAGAAWTASLAVGYLAGHWALDASPDGHTTAAGLWAAIGKSFKPHEARDWLPLAILLGTVPIAIAGTGKPGRTIAWLLRAALCVFLPWRLLVGSAFLPRTSPPNISFVDVSFDTGAWSTLEAVAWLGAIGVVLLAIWIVAECANENATWRLRGWLAVLVALGGAVTLAMSGSFTYGQLLGILTATLAGNAVVATMLRLERGPEAAAGPLVVVFGCTMVLAHFFSELKFLNSGLLLLAMTAAMSGWLPVPKLSHRMQAVLRCLLCLIPLAIAITLAAMDFSAAQAESESNPYLNFRQ